MYKILIINSTHCPKLIFSTVLILLAIFIGKTCGKQFPTNGSMQTHVKIVHLKTGSVKCNICNQGVANIFYLRKHCREMHPESAANNKQV